MFHKGACALGVVLSSDSPPFDAEAASRLAAEWAERSHSLRAGEALAPVPGWFGHFAQILAFGAERLVLTADGLGTKVEIAERLQRFDTLGYDLVAMVTGDLAAVGAEPCAMTNVLDVSRLEQPALDALFRGLYQAASEAGIALAGGELATLGTRVSGFGPGLHAAWSATGVGRLPAGWEPIDGRAIRAGQELLAVAEPGFRANGYTLVRRELAAKLGEHWHNEPCASGGTWGEVLLRPSRLTASLVVALRRSGVQLAGIAHITGGGIPNKLGRILRSNQLGAVLEGLVPPPAMTELVRVIGLDLEQAYRTFHMGPAMLLVLEPDQVRSAQALAEQAGFLLERVGCIEPTPEIRVRTEHGWLGFAPDPIWASPFDAAKERG